MPYALVQRTMTRPPVEALERAFVTGRGLTPADARFVADDAFGILARNLSMEDALFLQESLGSEGVEIDVIPESDLTGLPDAKVFCHLSIVGDRLTLCDALDRPTEVPLDAVQLIAAGFDQREYRLEIFLRQDPARFASNVEQLMFDRMPQYADANEPENVGEKYRNLVRDLARHCPKAQLNQAARTLASDGLAGDVTSAISYPRPMAYAEEITWLLWRIRSGATPL